MDVRTNAAAGARSRVLVIADWRADPYAVIAACRRRATAGDVSFALVVPAWLHGIDWVGDPLASRPCAARQLEALRRLAATAGLAVELAHVGDPDPTSAIDDAREVFGAGEILLCRGGRHRPHPFDLTHRVRRMTGLPVSAHDTRERPRDGGHSRWYAMLHGGHCACDAARAS